MKRILLSALVVLFSITSYAQHPLKKSAYVDKPESRKGGEVICPASHIDENTFRDMSAEVKRAIQVKKRARPGAIEDARFEVVYDPNMPEIAQESFQRAVDIWAELLNSSVKINVIALWQELGPNVLGSAGPGTYYRNFAGAAKANTWYPIALAEKMSGKELNSPDDFDIVARFSSDQNWYYGTTGTPAVGQFDFTSVVLHELCHGLGFVGSLDVEGTQGSYGFGFGIPVVFDTFVINEKDQIVTDTLLFKNPSTGLRNELISENLFFNSPLAVNAAGGSKVQLYAPTIFDSGSSIFHLDDKKYPAGTENSLMTPSAGIREINYDPGPITLGIMQEMGWRSTSLIHTALKDFEAVSEVDINVRIISDTTIKEETALLNYVVLDLNTATRESLDQALLNPNKVTLKRVGTSENFTAKLPVDIPEAVVAYFLTVTDNDGRNAVSPASMPTNPYLFFVGDTDQWGPTIEYYPPTIIRSETPVSFVANVDDDYEAGIDTVWVEYELNGTPQPAFGLSKFNAATDSSFSQGTADDRAYVKQAGIPALADNDIVTFRVLARDVAGNVTTIPTTAGGTETDSPVVSDNYEFTATSLLDPVEEYFTTFDEPTTDFAFTGFQISTPDGLSTPAMHSDNPYKNGLGLYDPVFGTTFLDFDYNAIALFRKPIILKADSATISWDEIVLVEPGEDGSEYGDTDFWDYVVVEVSPDYGSNWYEAAAGYDSRADASWNNLFTSTLSPANASNPTSNGTPSPALYRTREIDLYDLFTAEAAGAEILIRFRLYADQWVKGWGWAIDNLAIQVPKPAPLASEKDLFDLKLSPNPAVDFVDIKAKLAKAGKSTVEIFNVNGTRVASETLSEISNEINHRIDTRAYKSGSYLISLETVEGRQTKRFVIVK
ncbi:MAG: T9SS type A sorting domain-containing protein [Cytophagales bacterium]|nr:T9SS type A sorting domain-containing protein [Cytophagales bacterium]